MNENKKQELDLKEGCPITNIKIVQSASDGDLLANQGWIQKPKTGPYQIAYSKDS